MKGLKALDSQLCLKLGQGIIVTRNNSRKEATAMENSGREELHEHHAGERGEQKEQKMSVVPTQTENTRRSSLTAAMVTGMEAKARELEAKKALLGKTTSLQYMFRNGHGEPLRTMTTQPSAAAPSPPPAPIHESLLTKANMKSPTSRTVSPLRWRRVH
ncbi:hypothetical protein QOT17_000564 [Balamuthia mandrillaris]